MSTANHRVEAYEKYKRHLTKAQLADLLNRMIGSEGDLVSYDVVAKHLHARQQIEMGIQMVRLDRIVGSVGRYRDFTRSFLPRAGANAERWTRLDAAMNSLEGFPPIELFKIGEVYFVRDGNHRVSVARANESTHIEAYVTEVKTDIPLTVDDFERDEWMIKAEAAEFQATRQLDELRPGSNIRFTEPGRYDLLMKHIEVHKYLRDSERAEQGNLTELSWAEAVVSWYDQVYGPVVEAIRRYHLLDHFPGRTEADLYLWIAHHRERLAHHYGLAPLDPDTAVTTFAEVHSELPLERTMQSVRQGLHWLLSDERPLGMSEDAFRRLRERRAAGEMSLAEAEVQAQAVPIA